MPSTDASHSPGESELADRLRQQIRVTLEEKRDRIQQEIWNYPAPIPACDEQYNHLLEQRSRILRELAWLSESGHAPRSLGECRDFLDELVRSSRIMGGEAEKILRFEQIHHGE